MFTVKGNKIEAAGILFSLPDGFFFNADDAEDICFGGLHLLSPEGDCSICLLENEAEYDSAMDSLMDIFDLSDDIDMFSENETGYIWSTKPEITEINNLSCARVKYETADNLYYELHFERLEGHGCQLEVLLYIPKENKAEPDEVLNRKNVQEFYKSFHPVKGMQHFEN